MPKRTAHVVVLCEDVQQRSFLRRLLVSMGYRPERLRIESPQSGRGAASGWVVAEFPREAGLQRRATYERALVAAVDADNLTVDQRSASLWQSVTPPRAADEHIAVLIPKRNIETWIAYLQGTAGVNEQDVYRKLERPGSCGPAVARLLELIRSALPPDCLDSLRGAITDELRRLP